MRSRLVVLAVVPGLLAGCGDAALWARYRAERELWQARRVAAEIARRGDGAGDAEVERAAAGFRRIRERFPAARWATSGGTRDGAALDVARVSAEAALDLARLEQTRGRDSAAVAFYDQVLADPGAGSAVALEAALGRAAALSRIGRADDAIAAWIEIGTRFVPVDPERRSVVAQVLEAPLAAALLLERRGRSARADSVRRGVERRCLAALESARGGPAAPELWAQLAASRAARGDLDGSLDALRQALGEPATEARAPELVLALGERSLAANRPDSARAYAAWAERLESPAERAPAMLLAARAWEASGPPDSALAAYAQVVERFPDAFDAGAAARFQRGLILERGGSWERARSEYRSLAATRPAHPLAFAALLRVVRHHAAAGERELARIEGARALETVERLIASQRDREVQLEARRARADLLLAIGRERPAFDALRDLWTRYPATRPGTAAGLEAARLAETRLGDLGGARALYRQLEERAGSTEDREQARAALERLAKDEG